MRIGSLFAGIGGFDLAARWMGWTTAWFSEIEPYASAVLAKHWPGVPNHGDITHIDGKELEPVDLLCGGFPCQDISLAGHGAGIDGERSGLWSHYARLIEEIRPRWVVAENVSALRSRGLDRVLKDLMALRYDAEWHCIPAAAVGAPHRRDRIWIVAHPIGQPGLTCGIGDAVEGARGRDAGRSRLGTHLLDDAFRAGLQGYAGHGTDRAGREEAAGSAPSTGLPRGGPSGPSATWWATEPDVGRVAYGIPARVDRLRCLGNAIVPQVAYLVFQAIAAAGANQLEEAA